MDVYVVSGEKHSPRDGNKEHSKERVFLLANCDIKTIILSGPHCILILPILLLDLRLHLISIKILHKSFEL